MDPQNTSRKRVLILGGAGFIGSNLAAMALQEGYEVSVVDAFLEGSGGDPANLESLLPNITLYRSSVESLANLSSIVEQSDVIIDAMGFTSHVQAMADPMADVAPNLSSHIHLIKNLKGYRGLVIYLGSRAQYGKTEQQFPVDEEMATSPCDVQGINKQAAEQYFRIFSASFRFSAISLRLTNCFGPHQPYRSKDLGLMGNFIRSLLSEASIEVFEGKRMRQFVSVNDVSRCIKSILQKEWSGFTAFNVVGSSIDIKTLAKQLIATVGSGSITEKSMPPEIQSVDAGSLLLSDKKLREHLPGFEYSNLESALKETVNYFRGKLPAPLKECA